MDRWWIILAAGGITYATRLTGLLLGQRAIPRTLERFLDYVPMAVFAALITPDLRIGTSEVLPRVLGVIAAGLIVYRVRQLWAGLLGGMALYWLARYLL